MSNIVITKNMSSDERLAILKKIHQKFSKKQSIRARLAEGASRVRKWTDGSKYLAKHYGSRLADQRSYESEEGWN